MSKHEIAKLLSCRGIRMVKRITSSGHYEQPLLFTVMASKK